MQDAIPQTWCQSDVVDVDRANALAATLGIEERFENSDPLPPFFHQIYFWQARPASELGRDGHPRVGGLIPDMGLPRRMWAGGRLNFHAPFRAGLCATKTSVCERSERKEGRSGPLALVTLRHDVEQGGNLCVTEWQDLVYLPDREIGVKSSEPPKAMEDAQTEAPYRFDTTQLFRYSALTFNGHRIHYDLDYAQGDEGYAGLVVHGPLLAQLLMLKAVKELGPLDAFSFRATAPLMHHEAAALCRRDNKLRVVGPNGRLCMTAEARPRSE